MMVEKLLAYDPTLVRYTEPNMDDTDAKNTGGKYRIIPIFEKAASMERRAKPQEITPTRAPKLSRAIIQ